jgi:VWFA-related protein
LLAAAGWAQSADDEKSGPVFRSEVSMGRIDAQVLDGDFLSIANLTTDDFVLRRDETKIPIRNFRYEDMPVDVLLLLDVSGSMRPNVERVAAAADRALAVLGPEDRIAIMVFNTGTSVRLKFGESRDKVERKLNSIAESSFGGGTDINGALLEAAEYIGKEARRDARRAIVIVTDDQARPCDRERAAMALSEADAVLMALLAPVAFDGMGGPGRHPTGYPPVMGPWPGGPLGGVILGPRRGPMGGPLPGGAPAGVGTSAGTEAVARESGGESLPVNNASALETAFQRIRQRYAIYYHLPEGIPEAEASAILMDLSDSVRVRYPKAELRYRQVYQVGAARRTFVKRVSPRPPAGGVPAAESISTTAKVVRRRPVSESTGPRVTIAPVRRPTEVAHSGPSVQAKPDSASPSKRQRRPAVSEPHGPRVSSIPPAGGGAQPEP